MNFIQDKNAETSGTSLYSEMPSVSMDYLCKKFPEAFSEYEEDSEKGYGHQHLSFRSSETGKVFTVYTRWGIPRIGAPMWTASDEEKEAFYQFLISV